MATIYVVRHGQCYGNAAHTILDPFTDELTSLGQAQAELVGDHLRHVVITRAFSSDYLRAKQTAQIILDKNVARSSATTPAIDKRLRELSAAGSFDTDKCNMPSESYPEFKARIINFFSELIDTLKREKVGRRSNPENILVVSHGVTIIEFMRLLGSYSKEFGINRWTHIDHSENLLKNASFHKLSFDLELSNGACVGVVGRVECAHFRQHLEGKNEPQIYY